VRLRNLFLFIILSYGIALMLDILLWANLPRMNPISLSLASYGWTFARMYSPAVAAAICLHLEGRMQALKDYLKHDRRAIKQFLAAPLIAYLAVSVYLFLLLLLNLLDLERPVRILVEESRGLLTEENAKTILLLQIALSYPAALTVNSIFALGEEIGWRGYLFELTGGKLSARSLFTVGLVWGLWHSSAIALLGYNYPSLRALGIPLFAMLCVLFSLPMLKLVESTRSVLPAVSLHGAINALAAIFTVTSRLDAHQNEIFGGLGLLRMISWGIAAVVTCYLMRRPGEQSKWLPA